MAKGMWVETHEWMEVQVPAPKSPAIVVINEKHQLMAQQIELLEEEFSSFEELRVSEAGWDKTRIREESKKLAESRKAVVVLSPIPLLLGLLASARKEGVYVFHNDLREKKEVPDGKGGTRIIFTVAPNGWELVDITE